MVQNCSIEEVCNKTFAYSYSGIRSIERTLRSQLSKCYASLGEITILFFCSLANVALCCCCCCCCIGMMENALKQFLAIWSWSQFLICVTITRWSVPPKNRSTLSRREHYMLLINKLKLYVVWKLQGTFSSLIFCNQSCAVKSCFIVTSKI